MTTLQRLNWLCQVARVEVQERRRAEQAQIEAERHERMYGECRITKNGRK